MLTSWTKKKTFYMVELQTFKIKMPKHKKIKLITKIAIY